MKQKIIDELIKNGQLTKILEGYRDFNDDSEVYDIPDYDEYDADTDDFNDEEDTYEEEEVEELEDELDELEDDVVETISNNTDQLTQFSLEDATTTKDISDRILRGAIANNPERFKAYGYPTEGQMGLELPLTHKEQVDLERYVNSLNGDADRFKLDRQSQLKVLVDARDGSKPARMYLYARYLRITARIYWHFYINFLMRNNITFIEDAANSSEGTSSIYFNAAATVRSFGYEILSNSNNYDFGRAGGKFKSPYDSFKPEKYEDPAYSNHNILDSFAVWYAGSLASRLKSHTLHMIRGGITGKIDKEDQKNTMVGSLDTIMGMDDEGRNSRMEPSVESPENRVLNTIVSGPLFDEIADWVETWKNPQYYQALLYWGQGLSYKEMAEKMGISQQLARALCVGHGGIVEKVLKNPKFAKAFN